MDGGECNVGLVRLGSFFQITGFAMLMLFRRFFLGGIYSVASQERNGYSTYVFHCSTVLRLSLRMQTVFLTGRYKLPRGTTHTRRGILQHIVNIHRTYNSVLRYAAAAAAAAAAFSPLVVQ